MNQTKIVVLDKTLFPVKGAKVAFEFTFEDHPLSVGFTAGYYTNLGGGIIIEHANTGRAYVYVNGQKYFALETGGPRYITVVLR